MGHPVGTCAMGPEDESLAVVDSSYRVYGVRNQFVVDASVMPVIPSANTNRSGPDRRGSIGIVITTTPQRSRLQLIRDARR
jgi:hypothetical protein